MDEHYISGCMILILLPENVGSVLELSPKYVHSKIYASSMQSLRNPCKTANMKVLTSKSWKLQKKTVPRLKGAEIQLQVLHSLCGYYVRLQGRFDDGDNP